MRRPKLLIFVAILFAAFGTLSLIFPSVYRDSFWMRISPFVIALASIIYFKMWKSRINGQEGLYIYTGDVRFGPKIIVIFFLALIAGAALYAYFINDPEDKAIAIISIVLLVIGVLAALAINKIFNMLQR